MLDLENVYRENRTSVFKYLRARKIPADQAEDLTQETFLKVNLTKYDPSKSAMKTYLCRIAHALAIDAIRKAKKAAQREQTYITARSVEMSDPENANILRDFREKLTPIQDQICGMLENGAAKPQICEALEINGKTFDDRMREIRDRVARLAKGLKINRPGRPNKQRLSA